MKHGKVVIGYGLILSFYLFILIRLSKDDGEGRFLSLAFSQLPVLMSLALLSYGLRYARWYWLLKWAGYEVHLLRGWLAYLSGFALTATPGKVGELIRIRYFERLGVAADKVMSAFVFERALDILVVFALAVVFIVDLHIFRLVFSFVSFFSIVLFVIFIFSARLNRLNVNRRGKRVKKVLQVL